jgi:hypothetical protein
MEARVNKQRSPRTLQKEDHRSPSMITTVLGTVADPECLYRIRIFPSRILGRKDSGSRIRMKEFKYF